MAFQLVKVESDFSQRARSPMNAIGLTQIRLPTARVYEPAVTERELFDRDLNLRLGFRYMRDLVKQFDGNVQHALLAYNRGPTTVANILAQGDGNSISCRVSVDDVVKEERTATGMNAETFCFVKAA